MQFWKKTFQEWWMSMDQKPKGRKQRRMVWKRTRTHLKTDTTKRIREATVEKD